MNLIVLSVIAITQVPAEKQLIKFVSESPQLVTSVSVSWDKPGRQVLYLWRDIDSTTRPYIPFQFFEFDAAPPITVNIAPTNVGKSLTYELSKPIPISESRPLFVGVRRSGEQPGFTVAATGTAAPNSIIETINSAESPRLKSVLSHPAHPFAVSISTKPAAKQSPWFKDVTKEEGLDNVQAAAITWADLDGNGSDELITSGPRVFNRVNGKFIDATEKFGLKSEQVDATLAADLDGDGDLDLVCLRRSASPTALIYKMEGGKYVLSPSQLTGSPDLPWCANIFDFDGDGHLDIFVGAGWDWNASRPFGRSRIWRNNGKGEFADVSDEYGFDGDPNSHWFGRVSLAADFWQTNRASLFLGTYYLHPDRFWKFENSKATDVAELLGITGIRTPGDHPGNGHGLGIVAMDVNQDGWLDLVLANLIHPDWRGFLASNHSFAFINDKKGGFTRKQLTELGVHYEETAADLSAADFDGDGYQDLFQHSAYHRADFYRGRSGGFDDYTDWAGVKIGQGTASAVSDFNRDGRPDLAVVDGNGGLRLLQNISPPREMVAVRFVNGTGVTATLLAHGKLPVQVRNVNIGRGSANQDSMQQAFAIDRKSSPKLVVLWPSGQKQTIDLSRSSSKIEVIEAKKN